MDILAHQDESSSASAPDPFACLYVIEVARGRIKVGYTCNPTARLALHREYAEAYGGKPGREYVSPPGTGTLKREAELISFCDYRAKARFRGEFFKGVGFVAAVRCAAELCEDWATLRDTDRALPATRRMLNARLEAQQGQESEHQRVPKARLRP